MIDSPRMSVCVESEPGRPVHAGQLRKLLQRYAPEDTLVLEDEARTRTFDTGFATSQELHDHLGGLGDYDAVVFVADDGSRWVPADPNLAYVLGFTPNELHVVVVPED